MNTNDFFYDLPPGQIAQTPAEPRDHSRLFVLHRDTGAHEHQHFFDIIHHVNAGDLIVVNESKVFKARLTSRRVGTTADIEIFLIRPENGRWIALAKPGKKLRPGDDVEFRDGTRAHITEKRDEDGTIVLAFEKSAEDVMTWADRVGAVPIPPYIDTQDTDAANYQTVYAKTAGSVAAPTAGLHFTPDLIEKLKAKGVRFATVTLHVGLGTFRPIKTDTLEAHTMHEEWIDVPDETMRAIEETKAVGKRVIAVGTTTVRALESGVRHGMTNIFITPGYRFKIVDALITNFHLPASTLLVLVSTFAAQGKTNPDDGRQLVLNSYREAIDKGYRFYSFGDAMLIE